MASPKAVPLLTAAIIAQVDAWRAQHPELPERDEAVRLLLERGMATPPVSPIAALFSKPPKRAHPISATTRLV